MGLKVTNNAFGTLNAGINSTDTVIVLEAGQGARFPVLGAGDYFYATLIDTSNQLEIVKVTARATDTMTVVRAQDGTTARAYNVNDRFELRPTAALFNEKANADDVTASLATKVDKAGDTMTGPLTINTGSNGTPAINLNHSNTDADNFVIQLGIPGVSNGGFTIRDIDAAANRLVIDSAGRVTMPFQPAFMLGRSGGEVSFTGTNQVLTGFNFAVANVGGHMNVSTGTFTAPISGTYLFQASVWHNLNISSQSAIGFFVNGSQWDESRTPQVSGQYHKNVIVSTIPLAANDTVQLRTTGFNQHTMIASNQFNKYSGYLLG